jgi:uncharacterized membrane protein
VTTGVLAQLDDLERRLNAIHSEVRELRAAVLAPAAAAREPEPAPAPTPVPPPSASQRAWAPPAAKPVPAPAAKEPSFWDREVTLPKVELADLLGARALAWAGGVVTLLGVVFFFVLAVNRGWIGPEERVGLGALASLLVFAGGLIMRHRYGQLYSAVSAVGAGIAGGYATLLAAAAMYGLVPDLAALAIAAGIAAAGTAVALAWNSETVASLGLVGATLVPLAHAVDTDIGTLGTAFAALVFAGVIVVAIRRGWDALLTAGAIAVVVQACWLVLDAGGDASTPDIAVAAAVWLLLLAAGIARREARAGETESLSTTLVLGSSLLAGISARVLFEGELAGVERAGLALSAVALTYGVLSAAWFRRDRDLSALLGAIGLAAGAVATADLLGGGTLAMAFAAEAALLAWVAYRLVEPRYGFLSLGYLVLAVGHAFLLDAHPRELFESAAHPAGDAHAAVAAGLACLVVAFYAVRWRRPGEGEPDGVIEDLVDDLIRSARTLALIGVAAGATLLAHAASLGLLEAGVALGSFGWAQVAVTAFWGMVAAASVTGGRRWPQAELYGLAWVVAAIAKLVGYDALELTATQAGVSALALAAAFLAASILGRAPVAVAFPPVAAVLAAGGALSLGGSETSEGLWTIAVAGPFAVLAAARFRDRLLATALWSSALVLGLAASTLLVEHTELVAVWAVAAGGLAALAELTRERRLHLAAYAFTALALGYTLYELAPPEEFLVKQTAPADGVLALLLGIAALVAVTWRVYDASEEDELDRTLAEIQREGRTYAIWAAGLLGVYAASLSLLGLAQELGPDVDTAFQRGHTAISTLWGAIGLVVLYLGLKRELPSLRLAGFAIFGVSLAKIFLYDLSRLSSVTRALSFLAVGAVLLLAGFFYQRLTAEASAVSAGGSGRSRGPNSRPDPTP